MLTYPFRQNRAPSLNTFFDKKLEQFGAAPPPIDQIYGANEGQMASTHMKNLILRNGNESIDYGFYINVKLDQLLYTLVGG